MKVVKSLFLHILGGAERNTHLDDGTSLFRDKCHLHLLRIPEDVNSLAGLLHLRRSVLRLAEASYELVELCLQVVTQGRIIREALQLHHAVRLPSLGQIRAAVAVAAAYFFRAAALASTIIWRVREAAVIVVLGTTFTLSYYLTGRCALRNYKCLWFHNHSLFLLFVLR